MVDNTFTKEAEERSQRTKRTEIRKFGNLERRNAKGQQDIRPEDGQKTEHGNAEV
jgi:hypothetical protein